MEVAAMMADDKVSIVKLMPTILKYLLSAEKTRSMRFENLKWARLDLRVLDEADEEVGEISIRGPTVFAGYDQNAEANAKAGSKFLFFGDCRNDKGQLYISGRSKDMIIVGGENVFAVEVEQVIQRIPGILRSAVSGAQLPASGQSRGGGIVGDGDDDDRYDEGGDEVGDRSEAQTTHWGRFAAEGFVVRAYGSAVVHAALMLDPHGPLVNLRDDEIEQKLCRTCADSLAAYKVHVWREEEFPMTGSGKPKKQESSVLSHRFWDVTDEDFDIPFMDLNMASMEFTRADTSVVLVINLLAGTLQGGELSPTLLFENDCLADLLKYIESREDLVLVQDKGDTEPAPDLLQLAAMEEQPENKCRFAGEVFWCLVSFNQGSFTKERK
ncbi:putative acyl--CoA ligase YdaB [Symbiodinium microadriaticum]|uniref:Putative acyl--CoA ligase YdaB n=1 Tax=Symbiodinium microadriaticum TaxID=2951 RepID=A0A1Q9F3Y0_SYMMI|nr:putative acyl--CoA ligase YdaB [Symbiodinium microadriaticum]